MLVFIVLYLFGVYATFRLAVGVTGQFRFLYLIESLCWPAILAAIAFLILSFEMKMAWRNKSLIKTKVNFDSEVIE